MTNPAGEITLGGTLVYGNNVDVTYKNPNRAGETIAINISNGDPISPIIETIQITLDDTGCGTRAWSVPTDTNNWTTAAFTGPDPDQDEIARFIQDSP
jgi:hypothetical protein